MNFDSAEWAHLSAISGKQPLYVRVFDVDYSGGYDNAVPLADLDVDYNSSISDGRQIIPTVYITNRVFDQLNDTQVVKLAEKIRKRITKRFESWEYGVISAMLPTQPTGEEADEKMRDSVRNDWYQRCNEIQIDCDWTAKTRDRYFIFLRAMKAEIAPKNLTCTVRLHQYRDRRSSGIPPVDRGMLMCYNVDDPKKVSADNAIFDPDLVKGYLKAQQYPLPLDVALPVFSWGTWFRGEEFQGLLVGKDANDLVTASALYRAEGNNRFRVLQDTVIGRDFLREGDLIRIDQPRDADLMEITALLRKKIPREDSRLVFFDWQTEKINRYEKIIQDCAARYR